ncbi:MAG: tRNA uridine-5-carboxymethylaminomethyl(34) synthesis GTPase MnmE, partial [Bacteroidales bacterium]|nr:tRNA uridine-5-carboxymethylaminomethyl(34) synthesis GTPase MnmE [Bacteroidales bacterium]
MYRNNNFDTIIAPATIPGTGAICVIRISGDDAISHASALISPTLEVAQGYSAHFCKLLNEDGSLLDEVVVTVFRTPHSYTGEDSIEISCHSSKYIVSSIIDLFIAAGCRNAEPGEFTLRAFLKGKIDLSQAEAVADLIASSSQASHGIAIKQLKGQVSNDLAIVRAELLKITSLLELELDFSEEDVEFTSRTELDSLCFQVCSHISGLCESFSLGNALKEGFATAIVGATNAGKSTLLNALLAEDRAIVSPIAGTTRDTIEDCITIDGITFRFIDTAGIRESSDEIEKIGIERSLAALKNADVVLCVLDSTCLEESQEMIAKVHTTLSPAQKVYWVWNKIDVCEGGCEGVNCGKRDSAGASGCHSSRTSGCESSGGANSEFIGASKTLTEDNSRGGGNGAEADRSYDKGETLYISAKEGLGIAELKETLATGLKAKVKDAEDTIISSRRHLSALQASLESLNRVRTGLSSQLPTDLIAEDLREVLYHLGTITGEITTPETLSNIFSSFCIG